MTTTAKRVFITGASGLLGRAILNTFSKANWECLGTAHSRADKYNLTKLDLNDRNDIDDKIKSFNPSIILHSAAQRTPNEVESNYESAKKLNVVATQWIAEIAASLKVPVIYISTDYVFDGTSSPYKETDSPNPVNKYGITKLEGEKVLLKVDSGNVVLRISVLYGDVEYLAESAVTVLMEGLLKSECEQKVSDYEIRWPSHVNDIAAICRQLAERKLQDPAVSGVFHWSGKESMTKYKMVQIMADVLSLPMNHLKPDSEPGNAVNRPFNCELDTTRLDQLGIGQHTAFSEGIKDCLQKYVK